MDTTLILWLWPVVVLGAVAVFGLYVTRKDSVRPNHRQTPAE